MPSTTVSSSPGLGCQHGDVTGLTRGMQMDSMDKVTDITVVQEFCQLHWRHWMLQQVNFRHLHHDVEAFFHSVGR